MSLAPALMTASAAILLVLATMHLVFTFRGPQLTPRDPALQARMREVAPVISRQSTMWKLWIGFNVSHSLGGICFGAVYGYLALAHPVFLFQSRFLLALGLALLCAYAALGKIYWFNRVFAWIVLALACYLGALVASWAG